MAGKVEVPLKIYRIRDVDVVLDRDLAGYYGVETRQFNRAVLRNITRFPNDFSFVLEKQEFSNLMCQFGTSSLHGGRRKSPRVFTEHGAVMAASLLKSDKAVKMSVLVVRAFVAMRRELQALEGMQSRLEKVEEVLVAHDEGLRELVEKIRPLFMAPEVKKGKIGFRAQRG